MPRTVSLPMSTTTSTRERLSPADLMTSVPPNLASRFGPGRAHLLAVYGRGQVSLPQNTIAALEALARTEAARRELVTYDPGLARGLALV